MNAANDGRDWAIVLGASSGFGGACALALAEKGLNIAGVHLDRRATLANAEAIAAKIEESGVRALFFNTNAADDAKRATVLDSVKGEPGGRGVGEGSGPLAGIRDVEGVYHG